jgi:2-C-methyl-D-erythritol 4-phosphate cytidylyltransferase
MLSMHATSPIFNASNSKELWVILLAAGSGERFEHSIPPTVKSSSKAILNKLLLPLPTGRLVLQEGVYRLGCVPCVAGIVVLTSKETEAVVGYLLGNPLEPIVPEGTRLLLTLGGDTRRASVLAGLEAIKQVDPTASWVAVHDAARPLVDGFWLQQAFEQSHQLLRDGVVGICAGTKIQDTIKACTVPPATLPMENELSQLYPIGFMPLIAKTIDRTPLWQVQTPQLFSFPALCQAHTTVNTSWVATDDAQLIEMADLGSVVIKQSSAWNLKITTWFDYQVVNQVLKSL